MSNTPLYDQLATGETPAILAQEEAVGVISSLESQIAAQQGELNELYEHCVTQAGEIRELTYLYRSRIRYWHLILAMVTGALLATVPSWIYEMGS